jgi:hypothetical protein
MQARPARTTGARTRRANRRGNQVRERNRCDEEGQSGHAESDSGRERGPVVGEQRVHEHRGEEPRDQHQSDSSEPKRRSVTPRDCEREGNSYSQSGWNEDGGLGREAELGARREQAESGSAGRDQDQAPHET